MFLGQVLEVKYGLGYAAFLAFLVAALRREVSAKSTRQIPGRVNTIDGFLCLCPHPALRREVPAPPGPRPSLLSRGEACPVSSAASESYLSPLGSRCPSRVRVSSPPPSSLSDSDSGIQSSLSRSDFLVFRVVP